MTVDDLISELQKLRNSYGNLPVKMDALCFDDAVGISSINPAGSDEKSAGIEFICINTYET